MATLEEKNKRLAELEKTLSDNLAYTSDLKSVIDHVDENNYQWTTENNRLGLGGRSKADFKSKLENAILRSSHTSNTQQKALSELRRDIDKEASDTQLTKHQQEINLERAQREKFQTEFEKWRKKYEPANASQTEAPKAVPRLTEQDKYRALKEKHRLNPNSVSIAELNEQGERAHFERDTETQALHNEVKKAEHLAKLELPGRIKQHTEAVAANKEDAFLQDRALASRPWLQKLKDENPAKYADELKLAVQEEKTGALTDVEQQKEYEEFQKSEAKRKGIEEQREEDITKNATNSKAAGTLYESQPEWMIGPSGMLMNTIRGARAQSQMPYKKYEGQRSAGLTPLQEIAAEKSYQNLENPELKKLFTHAQQNLVEGTNTPAYEAMVPYKNQYEEEVMNGIQRRMTEHYKNDILPGIEANFINRGAWDSSGRQNAVNRATEEHMRGMGEALGEIGHRGHQSAIQNAQEDMKRKIAGGAELKDLKSAEMKDQAGNISELERLGSRAQLINQEKLNRDYEDWAKQQEHPFKMFERENAAVRGLQVPSYVYETKYNAPQPNAATQIGGGLLETFANMQRNKNAAGGRIRLAGGGLAMPSAMLPEEQDYQNRLQMATNKMEQSSGNPMWSMLAGVGRGIATSQHANPMRAIAEAIPQGNQAYRDHQDADETRRTQALNLRKMIAESRRVQEDRVFKHKLDLEDLAIRRLAASNKAQPQTPTQKLMAKINEKKLEGISAHGDASRETEDTLKTLESLNKQVGDTSTLGMKKPDWYMNVTSPETQSSRESFVAAKNKLVANVTATQKGAQSDRDMELWLSTAPDLSRSTKGNEKIIQSGLALSKRAQELESFVFDMTENYGVQPIQAQKMFKTWANSHPLLNEDLTVNEDNVNSSPYDTLNGDSTQPQEAKQQQTQQPTSNLAKELVAQAKDEQRMRSKHARGGQAVIMTKKESLKNLLGANHA